MNKASFVVAAALLLLLSGCGLLQDSPQQLMPSPESTSDSSPAPEVSEKPEEQVITEELARAIMQASYEEFELKGMTETVFSEGETWKLVLDPEQPDYQAALFNLDTGERQLVFETDYFTLFVGYLMLESPGSMVQITENGFIASAEEYNPIEYFVEDGLVVGARGVNFDWSAQFDYSVDPSLREGLLQLTAELLASFEE